MTDNNQKAMDQEDLEFLRELREIPEKITLPPDFHNRVMQTIYQREVITLESEEQRSREQPLRFPGKEIRQPEVRKRRNWWKVAALAQAAVIVLIPIAALFVSGTIVTLLTAASGGVGMFQHNRFASPEIEMEERIAAITEQLQVLESNNQERYGELTATLEDVQGKLNQIILSREALAKYVASISATTRREKQTAVLTPSQQAKLLMWLFEVLSSPPQGSPAQTEKGIMQAPNPQE